MIQPTPAGASSSLTPADTALAQIDKGNFAAARDLARAALAQHPRDAECLRALGLAEFRLGRHAEAIDALRRSVRIDPSRALAHLALANALQEQGALEPAIT